MTKKILTIAYQSVHVSSFYFSFSLFYFFYSIAAIYFRDICFAFDLERSVTFFHTKPVNHFESWCLQIICQSQSGHVIYKSGLDWDDISQAPRFYIVPRETIMVIVPTLVDSISLNSPVALKFLQQKVAKEGVFLCLIPNKLFCCEISDYLIKMISYNFYLLRYFCI